MEAVVTIFGSSKTEPREAAYADAFAMGAELARRGLRICNGGYGGTMEASARGAREAGGRSIGVTTPVFSSVRNSYIDEEIRAGSHVERLMKLVELGDGYIVLPGGTGTLLEAVAVLEYVNKRLMGEKPLVFFGEFWRPFLEMVREKGMLDYYRGATDWCVLISDPAAAAEFIFSRIRERRLPDPSSP